jgi:phage gp46-like protein
VFGENGEGNSRALGGRHGDWFLGFGWRLENGLVLWELRRERRLRNLWRDSRRRRSLAGELESGVAEKIHEHAEHQAQG